MKVKIIGQNFEYEDKSLTVSKSVGIYECEFEFDSSWDGFNKTAVFEGSGETIEVVISDGKAMIPWEVLTSNGFLKVGVYGTKDEKVMPTIWGNKVFVPTGTPTGSIGTDPTPSVYAQILAVANEAKDTADDVAEDWANVYAEAETLEPYESATAEFDHNADCFRFGIPRGERGQQGEQGERGETGTDGFSPTVETIGIISPQVGTRVTITDAEGSHSFDVFDGQKGEDGNGIDRITRNTYDGITYTYTLYMTDGTTFSFSVSNGIGISNAVLNADYTLTLTYTDGTTYTTPSIRGEQGATGETGATPDFSIGTVTTLQPNESATASISGTAEEPILNLGIPRGQTGTSDFASYLPIDSASGTIASFTDGAEDIPVESCVVALAPVQDLNGQSSPYPAGGGVNKWDEQWEVGGIANATGATFNATDRIRSKNFCACVASTSYYGKAPTAYLKIYWYDSTQGFISYVSASNTAVTSPSNASYFKIVLEGATTYANNISINYPSTDTSYHPYSNICPISGRNSVDLVRCGVNAWDEEWESGSINGNTGQPVANASWSRSADYIEVKPNTQYYMYVEDISTTYTAYRFFYDAEHNYIFAATMSDSQVFTTPSNCAYMKVQYKRAIADVTNYGVSINYPSTDHDYHSYQGDTYPISLGQTVYGGVLDVTSGVLTVTHGYVSKKWSEGVAEYAPEGNAYKRRTFTLPQTFVPGAGHSILNCVSIYNPGTPTTSPYYYIGSAGTTLYLWLPVDTDADFMIELCGELATPTTLTLTPQEIATFKANNNIWSDNGTISVTYRADIQGYIDKKISALATL